MSDEDSGWLSSGDDTLWSVAEAVVGATVALVAFNLIESAYPGTTLVPFLVAIVVGLVVANLARRVRKTATE